MAMCDVMTGCPVCGKTMPQLLRLSCGHGMCMVCVLQWCRRSMRYERVPCIMCWTDVGSDPMVQRCCEAVAKQDMGATKSDKKKDKGRKARGKVAPDEHEKRRFYVIAHATDRLDKDKDTDRRAHQTTREMVNETDPRSAESCAARSPRTRSTGKRTPTRTAKKSARG